VQEAGEGGGAGPQRLMCAGILACSSRYPLGQLAIYGYGPQIHKCWHGPSGQTCTEPLAWPDGRTYKRYVQLLPATANLRCLRCDTPQ
jgi:hypothetical protein